MEKINEIEILIVEDNPNDAELIFRALKKNNLANNVMLVTDGEEALDFILCRGKFEDRNIESALKIILLDLKLPKVSGLEVLKIVKEDKRTSQIPVVVLTSSGEGPDIQTAYNIGANSYVVKPIDFAQYISALSSLALYWLHVNEPLTKRRMEPEEGDPLARNDDKNIKL